MEFHRVGKQEYQWFWEVFDEHVDDQNCADLSGEVLNIDSLETFDAEDEVDGHKQVDTAALGLGEYPVCEAEVVGRHLNVLNALLVGPSVERVLLPAPEPHLKISYLLLLSN